jgi:UDP-3-O-acyl N-acetylglucosamine deacetylase
MSDRERTIRGQVALSGLGVHSGRPATLVLSPGAAGSGVVFARSDLPGKPEIPARLACLAGTARGIALKANGAEVRVVEHLLAAAAGLGVDNLRAEVDGLELPILDGSALPFARALREAGIEEQGKERNYCVLASPLKVGGEEGMVAAFPAAALTIHYAVAFDHPLLRSQYLSVRIEEGTFVEEVAPARTFGFLRDALDLIEKGLIKGTSLDNTVVIGEDAVFSREGLRFPDECVRHKILDLTGDLVLLGKRLKAEVIALKAGHELHARFIAALMETCHG